MQTVLRERGIRNATDLGVYHRERRVIGDVLLSASITGIPQPVIIAFQTQAALPFSPKQGTPTTTR